MSKRRGAFCLVLSLLWAASAWAASCEEHPASSGHWYPGSYASQSLLRDDVASCTASASSGATVHLKAGNETWTSSVTVGTGQTILGAGKTSTLLSSSATGTQFFSFSTSTNVRITGIGFTNTYSGTTETRAIYISGTAENFRIDHNDFTSNGTWAVGCVKLLGIMSGLIDNNSITATGGAINYFGSDAWTPWSEAMNYGGTAKMLFVENNTFTNHSTTNPNAIDANDGARYTFRHNTLYNYQIGHHGFDSGITGTVQYEVYGNHQTWDYTNDGNTGPGWYSDSRSGSGFIYQNYMRKIGSENNNGHNLRIYRANPACSECGARGICNGSHANDTNADVWTGTHTGSDSATVLTSSTNHNWTVDLYINSYIFNTTDGSKCEITDNDATTVTCAGLTGGTDNTWQAGDSYALRTGYICKQQPGRGTNDGLYPVYYFGNQKATGGTHVAASGTRASLMLQADRDWYSQADWQSDGSHGAGCGTSKPATCTTGVGYFETINSCSDLTGIAGANPTTGVSGTFYKCTDTNTWTNYYTPYTFPHPLAGGGGGGQGGPTPGAAGVRFQGAGR